jgi:hypothetical protein
LFYVTSNSFNIHLISTPRTDFLLIAWAWKC